MNVRRVLVGLMVAIALGGCASNELLRLETGDFIKDAAVPVAAARAVATERLRLERELYITLYTLDSNCAMDERKVRLLQVIDAPKLRFCAAKAEDQFSIEGPISPEQLAREQATVRVVSSYIAALGKAVALPKESAKEDFEQVVADLNLVKSALGGSAIPDKPAAAIGTLIAFVEKLRDESDSAKKIRIIVDTKSGEIEAAFTDLANTLTMDEAINRAQHDLNKRLVDLLFKAQGDCLATPTAAQCNPFVRHVLTATHFAIEDAQFESHLAFQDCKTAGKSDAQCASPAAEMMKAAAKAHIELVNLVKGNLSKEQRELEAKLAFRRFMDTLGVFVKLRPFI